MVWHYLKKHFATHHQTGYNSFQSQHLPNPIWNVISTDPSSHHQSFKMFAMIHNSQNPPIILFAYSSLTTITCLLIPYCLVLQNDKANKFKCMFKHNNHILLYEQTDKWKNIILLSSSSWSLLLWQSRRKIKKFSH